MFGSAGVRSGEQPSRSGGLLSGEAHGISPFHGHTSTIAAVALIASPTWALALGLRGRTGTPSSPHDEPASATARRLAGLGSVSVASAEPLSKSDADGSTA